MTNTNSVLGIVRFAEVCLFMLSAFSASKVYAEHYLETVLPMQYIFYAHGKDVRPLFTVIGLGANIGYFASNSLSLVAGYEINAGKNTLVMHGFETGLRWNLIGGISPQAKDSNIIFTMNRSTTFSLCAGIMQRTFNFSEFDSTMPTQIIVGKRAVTQGSFSGPFIGIKYGVYLKESVDFTGGISATRSVFSDQENISISRIKVEFGLSFRDLLK